MEPTYLMIAGLLGMGIAGVHGYLGQVSLLNRIEAPEPEIISWTTMVFHMSTAYWFLTGVGLIWASTFEDHGARSMMAIVAIVMYGPSAVGNFVSSRGRHFGWVMLAIPTVLCILVI